MPNLDCDETVEDLLSLFNPDSEDLLNKIYVPSAWDTWDQGPYQINFMYRGTEINYGKWYIGKSMRIRRVKGFEPGDANWSMWDYGQDGFNLPLTYLPGQIEVRVSNYNDTETYFRGRLQSAVPETVNIRPDNTENQKVKLQALDLKGDFKRILFSESYPSGVTTYGIIKDVITNKMPHKRFDASSIDASKGFVLDGYEVFERFAADVIQELLDLEITTVFKFDLNTLAVTLADVTDPAIKILSINDTRNSPNYVYNYFTPKFNINRQQQVLRNRVIFWFNGAYDFGTVNVVNGSKNVIGVGTLFTSNVRAGARFVVDGDNSSYSVEEVLSNTSLRLSSEVQRTTGDTLGYSASSYRDRVVVDASDNIATMAAILSSPGNYTDNGVFMVKMPERPNPLTRQQATAYAQAYVNRMANSLIVRGDGETNNAVMKVRDVDAGNSIDFNLFTSRRLQSTISIEEVTLQEMGGLLIRNGDPTQTWYNGPDDNRIDPYHKINFSFTDRRLLLDMVIERTLQDLRDVRITEDDILALLAVATEYMMVADCVGIPSNIGPNGQRQGRNNEINPEEEIDLGDSAAYGVVVPGAYYAAPVNPGQAEAYCSTGLSLYSFAS